MAKLSFATYLHPQTIQTSKPPEQIAFAGYSWPYFSQVRQSLEDALREYPSLPVQKADIEEYRRVHIASYLEKLQQMAAEMPPAELPRLGVGCQGLEYCLPAYAYSLGGMFAAIETVKRGVLERAYCFSLGGHHAHADWGHGYCLLNPQAAAARYAQALGISKILIVDWDLHHGDGTQAIFARDNSVYCLSIHSIGDLYMAVSSRIREATTTRAAEIGHCNIPMLSEAFEDDFFDKMSLDGLFYRAHQSLQAFRDALEKIPWLPDLILIFSGYDAHIDDHGRGIANWTDDDFKMLTRSVLAVARKASCPVISVHGGGYNLPVAVKAAVSHVSVLANE